MADYLFIDGAFFESVFSPIVKYVFPHEELFTAIDLRNLTEAYDRAFYYDALPAKKPTESESDWQLRRDQKDALFNKLSLGRNLHVRSGISRYRKRYRGTEQKGVDILLAIEALQHAMLGNIDVASFILSDLDFYPVFDALIQTRAKSRLYYHPHKTSKELIYAADVSVAINAVTLNQWLRDDLRGQVNLSTGPVPQNVIDQQTAQCGGRTIVLGEVPGSDDYIAYYEGTDRAFRGTSAHMLLSAFEDAPGAKVTGADRFGFP
jgi:uncharacterized LabA/DUF88 family protein